jgi:pilus assembly protein CpaC
MNHAFDVADKTATWRHAAFAAAVAATFALVILPTGAYAQEEAQATEPASEPAAKPAPKKPAPARKLGQRYPGDDTAADLNAREAERTAKLYGGNNQVDAKATVPAAPPAAPAVTPPAPPVEPKAVEQPKIETRPASAPAPGPKNEPRVVQQAPPAPTPTPVQPAPRTTPAPPAPTVTAGQPPQRPFAQSQLVPPQQPTLTLEQNKGTMIKLPGAAATVFVAAPDIADVQVRSPNSIYVFAKKPGDTVLYAVDDQDRVLLNTIVSVTSPMSRIKSALDIMHPGNGVVFENQGETIVLSGTVRSAVIAEDARRLALQHVANASKLISNIVVNAPNQVQLRVKVAEVQRDALKRVGVNWQNINNIALFTVGSLRIGGAAATISGTGGTRSGAIQILDVNNSLDSFIDMLATNSMATILAEPNLIAMSGETASFLAGGEIPLIVPQGGVTGSTISVSYKQVGVSLAFTPTIIGERINLKVAPEVSQLSTAGSVSVPLTATSVVTVPAIQTRKASTTIELGSGQSFAIAGLLQQTSRQDINKIPWLGDIPILGTLFKSDAYQRSETELVIIITPYFVEPVSTKLRTPLTGRVPPTDADRLVMQRMDHPTPPQRIPVAGRTTGSSAGFKLD